MSGTSAPCVVGVGDAGSVFFRQVAAGAVYHMSQLASVDEQRLAAPVLASATQESQAGGYLRGAEQLARQRDDAFHQPGLDDVLAYLALARLRRRHGSVRQHESGDNARREVVEEALHPREVGVARRRDSVLQSPVVAQSLSTPVGDVEWRVGEDARRMPADGNPRSLRSLPRGFSTGRCWWSARCLSSGWRSRWRMQCCSPAPRGFWGAFERPPPATEEELS